MSNMTITNLWEKKYRTPFSLSEQETELLMQVNKKESRRWGFLSGIVGLLVVLSVMYDSTKTLATFFGIAHYAWAVPAILIANFSLYVFLWFAMFRSYCTGRLSEEFILLSEKGEHACQEALGLCAVSPEAETLRATLVAGGSPLRVMHLNHLRKLSAKGACKKLHGIAA